MTTINIGKLRGLQQCTSEQATFTCLALDHRQNLRRALNPADPGSVSDYDLTRFKLDVTAALADAATAVLLDPQYSAAQAVAEVASRRRDSGSASTAITAVANRVNTPTSRRL